MGPKTDVTEALPIRALDLVLTSKCNLRCDYCFESVGGQRSMSWEVARAALDAALRSKAPEVSVVFFGGEPSLEFGTIRRAVAYAERQPSPPRLRFSLVTNGTILGSEEIGFLADNDVATQISFDGVREAQARRGAGTFDRLDALLTRVQEDHAAFFVSSVSVAMTVSPRTIPYFARSVSYLIERGVRDIAIAADMNSDPEWADPMIKALDRAFASVFSIAKEHYRRTGRSPVSLFRNRGPLGEPAPGAVAMCGIVRGGHVAVDVDGTLACCGAFAPSIQSSSTTALAASHACLAGGNVRDPDVPAAVTAIHRRAIAHGIFGDKREKHSSRRRCGTCRYLRTCVVCPRAIALIPRNEDPRRLPSFPCAFNRVRMKYWERFPVARPLSAGSRRRRKARLLAELARFAESASGCVPRGQCRPEGTRPDTIRP